MAEALIITRDDVVKFTSLNGNVDPDKFIQYIKIAQDIHVKIFRNGFIRKNKSGYYRE
jgi:uncharacterized protein YueI